MLDFEHVGDGRHAADRFARKGSQLERQRAGQLAVEKYRAAAHARDDARLLHLVAQQPHQNDVEFRTDGVVQHADHFQVDLFNLVALENRIDHALQSGFYIAQGKGRGIVRRASGPRAGDQEYDQKREAQSPQGLGHRTTMIPAGKAGGKPRPAGAVVGQSRQGHLPRGTSKNISGLLAGTVVTSGT